MFFDKSTAISPFIQQAKHNLSYMQALWYEGVGACARVGSSKFELLASINTRLSQWVSVCVCLSECVSGRAIVGEWLCRKYCG